MFYSTSNRFSENSNPNPGPGAYDVKCNELSKEGKYFVSKFSNSRVRTFSIEKRNDFANRNQVPGPGNYQSPSEFG